MMTEETKAFVFTCEWVGIGRGRLTLWHRPGARAVAALKSFGCDCVLTLLAAREHAAVIGQWVGEAGIEWLWLPLENGKPPQGAAAASILAALPRLSQMLDDGRSLFIHCAAGIHRTSMVAYALLRWRGFDEDAALALITQMRAHTGAGLQRKQINWGNTAVRALTGHANECYTPRGAAAIPNGRGGSR